jgi:hypothetical protein
MQQTSDVARFREEQTLQEQAARRALHSFAAVATHASITAHMERGAEHLLALFAEGKHEEAIRLWETTDWALEEVPCHTTINDIQQGGAACDTSF